MYKAKNRDAGMRHLEDDSPETIDLILENAIDESEPGNEGWKETREAAVETLHILAPNLLDRNPELLRIHDEQQRRWYKLKYDANDPI